MFVRETDQPDYFCTLCEAYITEEKLHSHLLHGHSAKVVQDYFVRVQQSASPAPGAAGNRRKASAPSTTVFICVVCWAKIVKWEDAAAHRRGCKVDPSEEDLEHGSVPLVPHVPPPNPVSSAAINLAALTPAAGTASDDSQQDVISCTPDISNILANSCPSSSSDVDQDNASTPMNGINGSNRSGSPLEIIEVPHQGPASKRSRMSSVKSKGPPPLPYPPLSGAGASSVPPCSQCTLCSIVLPTAGFLMHLRDFHRITCSLEETHCPLCQCVVPLVEQPLHLVTAHGIVPQTAVNALLLWVLSSSPPAHKPPSSQVNAGLPATRAMPSAAPPSLTYPPGQMPFEPHMAALPTQQLPNTFPTPPLQRSPMKPADMAAAAANGIGPLIPTVLQSLLSGQQGHPLSQGQVPPEQLASALGKLQQQHSSTAAAMAAITTANNTNSAGSGNSNHLLAGKNIVSKFTRCHLGEKGKESIQCLVCGKWFAVPPVKHLRGHMLTFKDDRKRVVSLIGGTHVCIICYEVFDSLPVANAHLIKQHELNMETGDNSNNEATTGGDGLGAIRPTPVEATCAIPEATSNGQTEILKNALSSSTSTVEIPTVIVNPEKAVTVTRTGEVKPANPADAVPKNLPPKGVELDNAGRVKSGKVRKQCELCGEWSNIKWFFKHMSEVHQALFCRCCREYLPIHEQEEHRRWHAQPPYMGQKIRLENGQPVIIDRKERASLTPIGSLAAWGGSSGGMVVKTVDTGPPKPSAKKRKSKAVSSNSLININAGGNGVPLTLGDGASLLAGTQQSPTMVPANLCEFGTAPEVNSTPTAVTPANQKDTLMPKEICPVCGISITYKNLARHIKLRHKIKFKFCYKCRQLVPNTSFEEHRSMCDGSEGDAPPTELPQQALPEAGPEPLLNSERNNGKGHEGDDEEDGIMMVDEDSAQHNGEREAKKAKSKLESLLGKAMLKQQQEKQQQQQELQQQEQQQEQQKAEEEGSRRRCTLCGETVTIANFKQHLRNIHPAHYQEAGLEGKTIAEFNRAVQSYCSEAIDEDQEQDLVECAVCGDHVLGDFMERHMKFNHPEITPEDLLNEGKEEDEAEDTEDEEKVLTIHEDKDDVSSQTTAEDSEVALETKENESEGMKSPAGEEKSASIAPEADKEGKKAGIVLRECPVCGESMRHEGIVKHCKVKHKVNYKWCRTCTKYISKKAYRGHIKREHSSSNSLGPQKNENEDSDSAGSGDEEASEQQTGNAKEKDVKSPAAV